MTLFAGRALRPPYAWAAVAALLCLAALAGWPIEREKLDWQPGLAFGEPWRAMREGDLWVAHATSVGWRHWRSRHRVRGATAGLFLGE